MTRPGYFARRPPAPGIPARRRFFWTASDLVAGAFLIAVAALTVIPLLNLVRIALSGDTEIWPDLAAYVIPEAMRVTVLLLLGVAAVTAVVGTGTAWLVTAYRFPGRDTLAWALALPLAFPTYIVAYVYVDFLDAFGPVQSFLHALDRLVAETRLLVSEHPLASRRDLRVLAGALSVCVPRRARDVPDAERERCSRSRAHSARRVSCWRGTSRCRSRARRWRSASRWC